GQEFKDIAAQLDKMAEALGRQEAQWQKSLQRQKELNQVLQMIAQNRPLEDTLNALIQANEAQIDGGLICITLLAPNDSRIQTSIAPSLPGAYIEALQKTYSGSACDMALDRITVTPDICADPGWSAMRASALSHGLRSCWTQPILAGEGKALGILAVYGQRPGSPSADAMHLSKMATEIASMAIEHNRHHEALRYQSRHDALTGLYTREAFITRLAAAIDATASSPHH